MKPKRVWLHFLSERQQIWKENGEVGPQPMKDRGMKAQWGVFEQTRQINDSRLLLKNCISTKDNVTSWNNNQDWCE